MTHALSCLCVDSGHPVSANTLSYWKRVGNREGKVQVGEEEEGGTFFFSLNSDVPPGLGLIFFCCEKGTCFS